MGEKTKSGGDEWWHSGPHFGIQRNVNGFKNGFLEYVPKKMPVEVFKKIST